MRNKIKKEENQSLNKKLHLKFQSIEAIAGVYVLLYFVESLNAISLLS